MKKIIVIALMLLGAFAAGAQELKSFKLNNGMSVYVWEDHSVQEVYGEVSVAVGSICDPEQYTGLAHYLEHMMFKGTQKIGTTDWEKEKPIYEQIIAKYDEYAAAPEDGRAAIAAEINNLSIEESKLSVLNEYANLIEGIGGSGLNAMTSFDRTVYFNKFPANEISKWLPLAAERFMNPVFRAFQSELETVYEEYNMSRDESSSKEQEFMLSRIMAGTPYARSVIGLGEHLKNPRLSQLIKFYEDWYVPQNMALLLVGNVETAKVMRLINATFGRIAPKNMPERPQFSDNIPAGRTQYTAKLSQYPSVLMAWKGVKRGDPDEIALDICCELLSNAAGTGLLDELSIAGDVMGASAGSMCMRELGRILLQAVPYYDNAQRRYDSSKKVEKLLAGAVKKLSDGDFAPETVEAIKLNLCRDYDLQMESMQSKAGVLRDIFIGGLDANTELQYKQRVMAITTDDIAKAAAKYFSKDYIVIFNEEGKGEKGEKIAKPDYKPLTPAKGQSSAYATWFRSLQAPELAENYLDWSKVQERPLNSYSRIYYTKNDANDVFTLILKYGANEKDFPKLKYGASLMNSAGILGSFSSQVLKQEFSRLGATCNISADNDYMYVTLRGYEKNLREACLLLTRLLLMPNLDEKQLGNVQGSAISSRIVRKEDTNSTAQALMQYILYGDESTFRKELSDKELVDLNISELTGSVLEATKFACEIHYSGLMPFDEVYDILSNSLPLQAGEKPTTSPLVRKYKDYSENTVFFIPDSECQQTQIYFYIPMGDSEKSEEVRRQAFSRYIGGSFNGLIMQEIREYNSMAYTAFGEVSANLLPEGRQGFVGYVGTQNDKALDAIKLYLSLINDMPEHPENLESIRSYLLQNALAKQPETRSLSSTIAYWKLEGYTEDPAKEEVPVIRNLNFDDILSYYKEKVKGKPIVIGVVGSPKTLNAKLLSEFGKVTTLTRNKLYNEKDVMF